MSGRRRGLWLWVFLVKCFSLAETQMRRENLFNQERQNHEKRKSRKEGQMKDRPVLFSGEMVMAILEGRKTQTRRVIKPQPADDLKWMGWVTGTTGKDNKLGAACWLDEFPCSTKEHYVKCPYGRPGDRLWVKETWMPGFDGNVIYAANYVDPSNHGGTTVLMGVDGKRQLPLIWKPSIFMPRWASRITLEIVRVGVERVQDISEEDAKAEGFSTPITLKTNHYPVVDFRLYWEIINGKKCSWESNLWVWAIEFKKVEVENGR